ncbi:MAG TPA: hypothetical protein VFM05_04955 [Candidatus Saccharimonadales bacterium]|nr:hypothetical protein [Candidatus Saccharimonadales bacterium]
MPSAAIIYGTGEGPMLSRRLTAALREAGFTTVKHPQYADIIIAHSGGTLVVPLTCKAKMILLVGPIAGHKGILTSMFRMVLQELRHAWRQGVLGTWTKKMLLNTFYIATNPTHLARMWYADRQNRNQLPTLSASSVGVISYKDDPWSSHLGACNLHQQSTYTFISFKGLHDDIWANPKEYVTVIRYLYEPRILA